MLSHLPGAIARGLLIAFLIVLPGAAFAGAAPNAQFTSLFLALCAAAWTTVEYISASPSLLEFRNAPPFNRIRFAALSAMVGFLTMIAIDIATRSEGGVLMSLARLTAHVSDVPYSPVRLLILSARDDLPQVFQEQLRLSAALAYTIAVLAVAGFVMVIRFAGWPDMRDGFNLWTNLPTFDPIAQGDVVERLTRIAHVNLMLAFLVPFLIPAGFGLIGGPWSLGQVPAYAAIIWVVTGWAFVPASLGMRGVALLRVAHIISQQREIAAAPENGGPHPATS